MKTPNSKSHTPHSPLPAHYSRFTDFDINLFRSGKHFKLYEKFGSHVVEVNGQNGTYFSVWAPNASRASVTGNFNGWNTQSHPMNVRWDGSGIWEVFIPGITLGEIYKYVIIAADGTTHEKSDPFALQCELPPKTASIVSTTWHEWDDLSWMKKRHEKNALNKPMSVYEMHLGSWMRDSSDPEVFLNYRQIADKLVPYLREMNFTHVEFMPIMEHPYYPSWGYQITGYFAATSRYGTPQDLMHLIEELHVNDIGVIMDWVPSHFPGDAHGLFNFDGTHLYEHADPRKGFHPDWKSHIFNYGRSEVRSFLISNALFWIDRYHADGLRIDAVASMLYLDYSRKEGEWIPNEFGGRENLEAISFMKELNEAAYTHFPDIQTIAEESTAYAGVTQPVYNGGLGFGMKWMMGWMNDTLKYFEQDPAFRKYHHQKITFSTIYAFTENFMLPFSHDEVVHGKSSMVYKMPGDDWQRFANLRALYVYMFTHPGTKLLFMGDEFGQTSEWNYQHSLDWHLLDYSPHAGMKNLVSRLNSLYQSEPALYEKSFSPDGFEWIEVSDSAQSVLVYSRKGLKEINDLVIILNLTPVSRENYRIGLPAAGKWCVLFNSDETHFGGSDFNTSDQVISEPQHWQNKANSGTVNLAALSGVVLKREIIV